MRSWKNRIRKSATEWLALPPDALQDMSRITVLNTRDVILERVEELQHVSDREVLLRVGTTRVRLVGDGFVVTLLAGGEVQLRGQLSGIEFIRQEGKKL